ncbi:MAG: glycoside hydrolase family 3 C-terminal domain-containing protein [Chloroflexota bacterium]
MKWHYVVSPLAGIWARVGDTAQVPYAIGCPVHKLPPLLEPAWLTAEDGVSRGLTLSYFDNLTLSGTPVHTEVIQKSTLSWFGTVNPYIDPSHFSLRLQGTLTVPESREYELHLSSAGRSRLLLDGVVQFDSGEQATDADSTVAEPVRVMLEEKRPYRLTVEFITNPDARWRMLRLGCPPVLPADPIQAAVDLAAQADVAVIVAGLSQEWESEGFDRPDLRLVGQQDELIARVAAANPRTIVVLNVGSPVEMPWVETVPAVLQQWYGGQEAGNALADVLFGDVNPSAKLPTTFPQRYVDNPAYINFPGENGKVYYGEGIFVGYRYYDKKDIAPLFPFGHGLSYTTFAYDNLRVNGDSFAPGDDIAVSVDVTNNGAVAGQEVVQLYVHDVEARLVRPLQELKAFAKVALQPGETKTITFHLDQQSLAFYDPAVPGWVTEPGQFEVRVGRSSRDICLNAAFTWQGERHTLHVGLKLEALLADERGAAILRTHLGDLLNHPEAGMAMGMTLVQLAGFVPDLLPQEKIDAIDAALQAA